MRWLDNTHPDPDLGGARLLMQTPLITINAACGGIARYIERPHHPARFFGGLFCGNTPDVAPGATLCMGGHKKGRVP